MTVLLEQAIIKNGSNQEEEERAVIRGVSTLQRVSAAIAGTLMNSISRYMLMGEDFCGVEHDGARDGPGSESSR